MNFLRMFSALFLIVCLSLPGSPVEADNLLSDGDDPFEDRILHNRGTCSLDATLSAINGSRLAINEEYYRIYSPGDDLCDIEWEITISGSLGTDTGLKVECTSGGEYDCPLLPHCDEDEPKEEGEG